MNDYKTEDKEINALAKKIITHPDTSKEISIGEWMREFKDLETPLKSGYLVNMVKNKDEPVVAKAFGFSTWDDLDTYSRGNSSADAKEYLKERHSLYMNNDRKINEEVGKLSIASKDEVVKTIMNNESDPYPLLNMYTYKLSENKGNGWEHILRSRSQDGGVYHSASKERITKRVRAPEHWEPEGYIRGKIIDIGEEHDSNKESFVRLEKIDREKVTVQDKDLQSVLSSDSKIGDYIKSNFDERKDLNVQSVGRSTDAQLEAEGYKTNSIIQGTIIDKGQAPFKHDQKNKESYFLELKQPNGDKIKVWGEELPSIISGAKEGDYIGLQRGKAEKIKIEYDEPDKNVNAQWYYGARQPWVLANVNLDKDNKPHVRQQKDKPSDIPDKEIHSKKSDINTSLKTENNQKSNIIRGTILDKGKAPYLNDQKNDESYFLKLRRLDGKEQTLWGKGIPDALPKGTKEGDYIGIRRTEKHPINMMVAVKNPDGKIENKEKEVYMQTWTDVKVNVQEDKNIFGNNIIKDAKEFGKANLYSDQYKHIFVKKIENKVKGFINSDDKAINVDNYFSSAKETDDIYATLEVREELYKELNKGVKAINKNEKSKIKKNKEIDR